MNKKRTVRNIGKEYSSYRGKVHNVYVNVKPKLSVGNHVPMNSFSPGHPVLGEVKHSNIETLEAKIKK